MSNRGLGDSWAYGRPHRPLMSPRKRRWSVVAAATALLLFAATAVLAAELVTAEVDGTVNNVTVTQGSSASFNIKLSATGAIKCVATSASPATAVVHTSYSISIGGAVSSSTPSAAQNFFGGTAIGGPNCNVTWMGAPTPYSVSASVSAAATTPVGDYTINLSVAAGTTAVTNPTGMGGTLADDTATTLTFHVVSPTPPADTTPPTNASITINDGDAWTNNAGGNVTVDISATDNVGVASYRLAETQAGLGAATAVAVSPAEASFDRMNVPFQLTGSEATSKAVWLRVCDAANNCTDANDTIGWDHTAPTVAYTSASPAPNAVGWNNTDVTVTFTATDTLSGFAPGVGSPPVGSSTRIGTSTTSGEGTAVTVGSPAFTDIAGNTAAAGAATSPAFAIDKTAPTVAYTSASPAPNANGWNNTDVTATFTATDNLSGFAPGSGSPSVGSLTKTGTSTTSGEGTAVTVGSPAFTDLAGNTAAAGTATSDPFMIDKTDPTAEVTGYEDGDIFYKGDPGVPPTVGCDFDDGLSGIDSSASSGPTLTAGGLTVNGVGSETYECIAVDLAGNSSSDEETFSVYYAGLSGFLQPINYDNSSVFKRGQAVPGKFRLDGDEFFGFYTGDWTIKKVSVNCTALSTDLLVEDVGSVTPSAILRYDASADQYIYNADFRNVTAGSCWKLRAHLDSGQEFDSAVFKVVK